MDILMDISQFLIKQPVLVVEMLCLDGLIKEQDAYELQYVVDLWNNLHRSYACKKRGVDFADEEALENLLELFSLKQISKSFFIRVALELCRTGSSSSGEVI